MKTEFASKDYTAGQLNAMVKKLIEVAGEKGPELLLQGRLKIEVIKDKVLAIIGTTKVPATTEKFVAKEKFIKNSSEVKFWGFWNNFTNWFLHGEGKIEDPQDENELQYGDLIKGSRDELILEELGGKEVVETTLTDLYLKLKKQGQGEEGELLTNGWANIFYIQDSSGVLRAVCVRWYVVGWYVNAFSVEYPDDWYAGSRVFSRNS